MSKVDCGTIKFSDYQAREAGVGFLSLFPFIGPTLAQFIPPVANLQQKLNDAKSNLQSVTLDFYDKVSDAIEKEATIVDEFVTLMIGKPVGTGGYIDVAIDYAMQQTTERSIMNSINIFFLGLLVSILFYYLISSKNG